MKRYSRIAAYALPVVVLLALVAASGGRPWFTPDSWSYYEISRSIFSDFGRINTIRQYQVISDYNLSFPPLYPVLIAIADALTGLAERTGVILNLLLAALTALALCRWFEREVRAPAAGALVFLLLLMQPAYMDDLLAGRALALQILLLSLMLFALTPQTRAWPVRPATLGALAALSVLARFDFVPAAAMLGLLFRADAKGRRLAAAGVYYGVLALLLAPWLLWNWRVHGSLLASDNSLVTLSAVPLTVVDYTPYELPTLFTDARLWLETHARAAWKPLRYLPVRASATPVLLALAACALLLATRRARLRQPGVPNLLWFTALLLPMLVGVVLTGYADPRYFVWLELLAAAQALAWLALAGRQIDPGRLDPIMLFWVIALSAFLLVTEPHLHYYAFQSMGMRWLVLAALAVLSVVTLLVRWSPPRLAGKAGLALAAAVLLAAALRSAALARLPSPASVELPALVAELRRHPGRSVYFDSYIAYEFGARTGLPTLAPTTGAGQALALIAAYRPSYVVTSRPQNEPVIALAFASCRIARDLWRIEPERPAFRYLGVPRVDGNGWSRGVSERGELALAAPVAPGQQLVTHRSGLRKVLRLTRGAQGAVAMLDDSVSVEDGWPHRVIALSPAPAPNCSAGGPL